MKILSIRGDLFAHLPSEDRASSLLIHTCERRKFNEINVRKRMRFRKQNILCSTHTFVIGAKNYTEQQ